jgi:twitching motility protein PilT
MKSDKPASGGRVDDASLLQILRVAADRGASTVYVVAQSRPMIRIDGEISALENETIFSVNDIERFVAALAPRKPEAVGDAPVEWISEVPEVGRVRCLTFRDHRGPGFIFRMLPAKSISAEHLNLSPEIRELAALADGLVLVTGARGSGKSTILNAFVDLVNRSRSDHLITIEPEIAFVHESRRSFVSQREVRTDPAAAAAAVQMALREDPDVLVIDELHSPEVVSAALEAAETGRLVFASITAPTSIAAIDALAELFPAPQRAAVRSQLSRTLRGVVSQVLLRKASGGRVTARELLLNSPAVAAAIRDGKAPEIAAALESGQRHGMISMNDTLAGLVRGGTVHSAEAYRRAPDRAALLACLARDGVDTSFAERLA